MNDKITIMIDSREQCRWAFPVHLVDTVVGTIKSGDYAVAGDEANFAIERKTFDDFCGTVSSGWERFKKEIQRMNDANFPAKVIIVETSFDQILDGSSNHPNLKPQFLCKRIAQLTLMGASVLFFSDASCAAGMAYRILKERAEQIYGT